MDVTTLTSREDLFKLGPHISRLNAQSSKSTLLFTDFDYISSYAETFHERTYLTYVGSQNGSVDAIGMFSLYGNEGRKILRFVGEGLWGYCGILSDQTSEALAIEAVLRAALKSGCDAIELGPLHESELNSYIEATNKIGTRAQLFRIEGGAPLVNTSTSYSEWLKSRKNTTHTDSMRRERRMGREGRMNFFKLHNESLNEDAIERAMTAFLLMYDRQWPENRFKREPRWKEFYKRYALAAARSETLEFSFLTFDDKPIAAHYGFVHKGRRYWFTPTYDIGFQRYSPGKVLLRKLIDISFHENVLFDFQNDLEPYKLDWATEVANRYQINIYRT